MGYDPFDIRATGVLQQVASSDTELGVVAN